jgi:hypothetical protein
MKLIRFTYGRYYACLVKQLPTPLRRKLRNTLCDGLLSSLANLRDLIYM